MVKGLLGRIGRSLRGLLSGIGGRALRGFLGGSGGRALRGFLGGSGGRALSRGEVGQDILKRLWKRTLKWTLLMDVADWGLWLLRKSREIGRGMST